MSQTPPPISPRALQQATTKALTLKERIKAASGIKATEDRLSVKAQSPEGKQMAEEIATTKATQAAPAFPTATILAAVRATDVMLPEALEQRVLMIAGLYLNGANTKAIAEKLELDPKMVETEVKKIDSARSVAYKQNPELAAKVVQKEYDVVTRTIETLEQARTIREMVFTEMQCDFEEGQRERLEMGNSIQEEEEDPETGKKKRRRPNSIFPMKLDSYTKLLEAEGKHLDRLTNIFGLIQKNIPDGTHVGQLNQTIVNMDAATSAAMAEAMIRKAGGHLAVEVGDTKMVAAPAPKRESDSVIETTFEEV